MKLLERSPGRIQAEKYKTTLATDIRTWVGFYTLSWFERRVSVKEENLPRNRMGKI